MHIDLIVGNFDAFGIKALLDLLEQVKFDRPVVIGFCPGARGDEKGRARMLTHTDEGRGVAQNQGMHRADFVDDLLCFFKIGFEGNRKDQVNTPFALQRIVYNCAV